MAKADETIFVATDSGVCAIPGDVVFYRDLDTREQPAREWLDNPAPPPAHSHSRSWASDRSSKLAHRMPTYGWAHACTARSAP
jgi:hypothetical protein